MLSSEIQIIPASVRYSQEGAWDLEKQTQCSDDGDPEAGISLACFQYMKLKEQQQANRGSGRNATEENFESFN